MSHLKASSDEHLEDAAEAQFVGATLTIASDNEGCASSREDLSSNPDLTGGIASQTKKDAERAKGGAEKETDVAVDFFATRMGAFENAVQASRPIILENLDGDLRGAWLLTEIDHWDAEKERLVMLTDHSLLMVKYDFITLRVLDYKRLPLREFDKIVLGEFVYPQASVVPRVDKLVNLVKGFVWTRVQSKPPPPELKEENSTKTVCVGRVRRRHSRGLRAMWNKGKPVEVTQSWNPWSRNIPWITYTSHPLVANFKSGRDVRNYDIDHFAKLLIQAVNLENESRPPSSDGIACIVEDRPIVIENYLGLASLFHNVNNLGFFKSRGRVSF